MSDTDTVYVATTRGRVTKAYHTNPECASVQRMSNGYEITIEEAKRRDLRQCKKCTENYQKDVSQDLSYQKALKRIANE